MWFLTGAARQALAQTHTAYSLVRVLQSGQPVRDLVATTGLITSQGNRSVMRNLTATIVDPTGQLSGGDINDLLSPYSCEVLPYRGVTGAAGIEYVPQGVYRLTQRQPMGDGSVQLTGQDRAMIYQGPMTGTLSIPAGTPAEQAITRLLVTRNSGVHMVTRVTGYTVGPLLYQPDIDVWAEAQKIAQGTGGWLYHDRLGQLIFGSALPSVVNPVAAYSEGDGVLQNATRTEDSDQIHNVVVVQNSPSTGGSLITATAEDADPTSPTYSHGSYGRHVLVVTNASVTSAQQAQEAATAQLVLELGRSETAQFTMVPDPSLDVLDAVIVNRPVVGLINHAAIVDQIQMPLEVTTLATVTCRKYIQLRDGQSVQTALPQLT